MSQSATLYRVSQNLFEALKTNVVQAFEISSAKNFTAFESSFMGLKYDISKGQSSKTIQLLSQSKEITFLFLLAKTKMIKLFPCHYFLLLVSHPKSKTNESGYYQQAGAQFSS